MKETRNITNNKDLVWGNVINLNNYIGTRYVNHKEYDLYHHNHNSYWVIWNDDNTATYIIKEDTYK